MKHTFRTSLFIIIAIVLSGCISAKYAPVSIPTKTPILSFTAFQNTPTLLPSPTSPPKPTITFTSLPTLESTKAQETIKNLLNKPVDCDAPCFWNITPSKTTIKEANNVFLHFGIQLKHTNTMAPNEFYSSTFEFNNGLAVTPLLVAENGVIQNIIVSIRPEKLNNNATKEWSAYSPDTLIKRYGSPSKVEFSVVWGPGTSSFFEMVLYFSAADLIVEYAAEDVIPWQQKDSPQICPLATQFERVRLWFGEKPVYVLPPNNTALLGNVTNLKIEEFSQLIIDNQDKSCFNLKGEMFP